MRHYFAARALSGTALPVTTLPRRVMRRASASALVACSGTAQRLAPALLRALLCAIHSAVITPAAHPHQLPAAPAPEPPQLFAHLAPLDKRRGRQAYRCLRRSPYQAHRKPEGLGLSGIGPGPSLLSGKHSESAQSPPPQRLTHNTPGTKGRDRADRRLSPPTRRQRGRRMRPSTAGAAGLPHGRR
jgi:hypothetical protein